MTPFRPIAAAALRALLSGAPPLLAAGCGSTAGSFPSLAPRPIERVLAAPPADASTAAIGDAALDARVAASLAAAEAGAHAFDGALAAARGAAARAGAATVGSEAWFTAQQAVTALGAARAPVATVLADLDHERIEAAGRTTPVETARLDAAYARVAAITQAQDGAYEAIAAEVPNE